uniref:Transporter n=1 Tax=Steinernema glaseri TaxID=37863 RepID=A0A1I7YFZ1_9BILA
MSLKIHGDTWPFWAAARGLPPKRSRGLDPQTCDHGWPSVFYVHGVLCFLITALWQLYFRNDPTTHPFVNEKELAEIRSGKTISKERPRPPYREIFTCPPLYGAWVAVVGNFFVCQYTITFLPMYLVWVIGLPVNEASSLVAVPLAGQFILKFSTGLSSDKIRCVSELFKVRLFNSLAFFGSAFFFLFISFFPPEPEERYFSAFLSMLPAILVGFNPGGFNKAAVLVSRQFSATVMAVFQVIVCTTLFFGSFIIPAMTPDNTFEQYRVVFYFYAAVLIVTNAVFLLLARASPAEWTKPGYVRPSKVAPLP